MSPPLRRGLCRPGRAVADLTVDWAWLYLQVALLAGMAGREVLRRRDRNLFAILVPATMLVLVQFQGWWLLRQFETSGEQRLEHLYNSITLQMARRANLYIGLGVLCYVLAYALSRPRRELPLSAAGADAQTVARAERSTVLAYAVATVWTTLSAYLLVKQVGGINLALTEPGRMIEGQTVFLLAVGMAKWPLVMRIATTSRPRLLDIALWVIGVAITLFNSRFLTAFAVLQLLIVINYCWKELSRRSLLLMVVPAVSIFLVFGLYRDYAYRFGTVGGKAAAQEFLSRPDEWNVGEWFYRTNVEGFTGVAGALTYQADGHEFDYDFGVSELEVFTKLIPNSVRNNPALPFKELAEWSHNAYPYTGSVVPSGVEWAYGHLSVLGILLYSAVLGVLTRSFHVNARRPGRSRLNAIVLSVQLLNGVRASLFFALVFFGMGDLVTLWLYRLFLARPRTVKVPITASAAAVMQGDAPA